MRLKFISTIKNWFKKDSKPKSKTLYAITDGTYKGTCVVFVEPDSHPKNGVYAAIAINVVGNDAECSGGMKPLNIPEEAIEEGMRLKILDKIRIIPNELYALCCAEYIERINNKEKESDNESID